MINDLTPERTLGLLLLAAVVWACLIVNSFYEPDSPIQFRVQDCHVAKPTARECPVSLVWVGF